MFEPVPNGYLRMSLPAIALYRLRLWMFRRLLPKYTVVYLSQETCNERLCALGLTDLKTGMCWGIIGVKWEKSKVDEINPD